MSKQLEWAKAYVAKIEKQGQPTGVVVGGSHLELYELAKAIIADAEGGEE